MQGGIEPGIITEFYGMGGAGKTNLSMIFSYSMVKSGRQVIYIDTEGFSVERFKQICGDDFNYNDINIYRVKSLDDQHLAVIKAEKLIAEKRDSRKSIGLMVVDSFTNFSGWKRVPMPMQEWRGTKGSLIFCPVLQLNMKFLCLLQIRYMQMLKIIKLSHLAVIL